jgi:glycosyltransferase involved in cell wall biosynthesis
MKTILFTYKDLSTFVLNDLNILKKHYKVIPIRWINEEDFIYKVKNIIDMVDITYSWFAIEHAYYTIRLSQNKGIKSIVVVGGWDAAECPDINYGRFQLSKGEIFRTKYVLKHSDVLLAVSKFTKNEVLNRFDLKNIKLVYNGVDINKFNIKEKDDIICTIGSKIELKGLETFAEVSKYFPNYKFVIIGINSKLIHDINPNIIQTGIINHNEVTDWLEISKVYCQLSYRESFGVALAESMLCGCIPLVTDVGAMKEVVGENGYYTNYNDVEKTIDGINKSMNSNLSKKDIRKRIVNNFSMSKREKKILNIIEDL